MGRTAFLCKLTIVLALGITGCGQSKSPPGTFSTSSYSFDYPAGWEVDSDDPDFDPESYFAVDGSADTAFIGIVVDDDKSPADSVEQLRGIYAGMMSSSRVEPFNQFAQIEGEGCVLRGELSDAIAPGEVSFHVFSFIHNDKTHAIVFTNASSETRLRADLRAIEASFKLK